MNRHILLQLFSSTKSNSTTAQVSGSSTQQSENYGSSTHSETSTQGGSTSDTQSHSNTDTVGQSGTETYGKSWASGTVSDQTQAMFDKYNSEYTQSDSVTDAYNALQEVLTQKPSFESTYADKLSSIYDQIMNRDKFSYNFNEDSMYQLYKDQYTAAGKQAMQDTIGTAQAANGGYGSSYAQSAGQQTYQNYLQDLNNIIPTLRDEAYQEYEQEGQDLLNKYDITNTAYNNEYNQYRDNVSDWQADRSFNYGMYSDERNFDYSKFADNRNYAQTEYWNEKNAEQSNYSLSNTNYWENSETNSQSHTDTSYWEDSQTNSNTNGWSGTTSNTGSWSLSGTNNIGTGTSSSGTTLSDKLSNLLGTDTTGYEITTPRTQSKTSNSNNTNTNSEIDAISGQNAVTNSLKQAGVSNSSALMQNGAVFNLDSEMSDLTTAQVKKVIQDMAANPQNYDIDGTLEELEWIAERYTNSKLETILGKANYQQLFG